MRPWFVQPKRFKSSWAAMGIKVLEALVSVVMVSASLQAGEQPNIVILVVDDMGFGDPGCFNPESKIRTPNIDRLAARGMRFTDAHAPGPLCHMSRYGLMTGQFPFRTDVGRWPTQALIEKGQTTVASMLKSGGYRTAMVGKWHLGFEENGYDKILAGGPVDVGFDTFFGIRASTDIPPYFYIRDRLAVAPPTREIAASNSPTWSPIQGEFWRAGLIAPDMELRDVLPKFTDEAISVITAHAAKNSEITAESARQPLFLYLAYPAPHTPWLPSQEFMGQSQVGMYGDFVEMVDAMIGKVYQSLEMAGLSEDTLLILTSDNGPVWYEADVARFGHDSAGGLRGMKSDAWEAGHRMPFVVCWPRVVQQNSLSQQTICFTDILATLAAITDYKLSDLEAPDSIDFSDVLRGKRSPDAVLRTSLAMQSGGGFMTLRAGDWKLIEGLGSGGFSEPKRLQPSDGGQRSQLFNLREDPGETQDLADRHPDIVLRLRSQLAEIKRARRTR